MTASRLDRLGELAGKATPGPWVASPNNPEIPDSHWSVDRFDHREQDDAKNPVISDAFRRGADAQYIAAASPSVVAALVRIAIAAKAVDRLDCEMDSTQEIEDALAALSAALSAVEGT